MNTAAFTLQLDTRGPLIDIYAPQYTNEQGTITITIESDENLSDYQNVYIIDCKNTRHNIVLSKQDSNTYAATLTLPPMPFGISNIYAQLSDDVGNLSNLAHKSIRIITNALDIDVFDNNKISMFIDEKAFNLLLRDISSKDMTIDDTVFLTITISED